MRMITSLAILWLCTLQVAFADAPPRLAGQISVREVSASTGVVGGTSRLHLIITNDSSETLSFLGVRTGVATQSTLMGRVSATDDHALGSFPIASDESLNLDTSHLWVSLNSLRRPLTSGDSFPVTLLFTVGELPVIAHVHP
jgi:copper(I)-binding protein